MGKITPARNTFGPQTVDGQTPGIGGLLRCFLDGFIHPKWCNTVFDPFTVPWFLRRPRDSFRRSSEPPNLSLGAGRSISGRRWALYSRSKVERFGMSGRFFGRNSSRESGTGAGEPGIRKRAWVNNRGNPSKGDVPRDSPLNQANKWVP